jgi:hypothetical protein
MLRRARRLCQSGHSPYLPALDTYFALWSTQSTVRAGWASWQCLRVNRVAAIPGDAWDISGAGMWTTKVADSARWRQEHFGAKRGQLSGKGRAVRI